MRRCGSRYCASKKTDDLSEKGNRKAQADAGNLRDSTSCFDPVSILLVLILVPTCNYMIYAHAGKAISFLRPVWDSPPEPFHKLPHYYHEDAPMEHLCKLHGWRIRDAPRKVYDAVLFNTELDMLTIRWNELSPYVDEFILLESDSTFTGKAKDLYFQKNRAKLQAFEPRLTYGKFGGRFAKGENPFVEESYQRVALDELIKISGIGDDDLLIMSDVDEIPYGHTIDLLRWCDDIPEIVHLQLKNFLYSFEFFVDAKSWSASVHRYRVGKTTYAHYRQSDELLVDSGWHCSFCFRHIREFVFKMTAYSHVDRVKFSSFMDPSRIQDVICRGADLFDMLPEEHTFRDIFSKMGPIPRSLSAVRLPRYLIEHADEYKFLLPGNCRREIPEKNEEVPG